jgi:hypothetical protein
MIVRHINHPFHRNLHCREGRLQNTITQVVRNVGVYLQSNTASEDGGSMIHRNVNIYLEFQTVSEQGRRVFLRIDDIVASIVSRVAQSV